MAIYSVKEKNGAAIQEAIDRAFQQGGGQVVLEPGCYLSGTIYLKSNVELHLSAGAKIQGYDRPELYDDFRDPGFDEIAPENSRKCLIAAKHAQNIAITGQGEINGAGPAFYDTDVPPTEFFRRTGVPRPRMVQFYDCQNVRIEGVAFIDSACWTFWLLDCADVHISKITISAHQQMMNNDGIDIDGCRRVTVSDSFFCTGDDCIVLRAIRREPNHPVCCEDVTVTNCVLNSWCQGIRVGCPSDDTIRRCTFSNITINSRMNGININNPIGYLRNYEWNKSPTKGTSNLQQENSVGELGYLHLSDLVFCNMIIHAEYVPLWINVESPIKLRYIGSMSFSNFRIRAKEGIKFEGCPETFIQDIVCSDIISETEAPEAISAKYVRHLKLRNVEVSVPEAVQ